MIEVFLLRSGISLDSIKSMSESEVLEYYILLQEIESEQMKALQ